MANLREEKEEVAMCSGCGTRPARDNHCPYSEEINETEVECDCCEECYRKCLEAI